MSIALLTRPQQCPNPKPEWGGKQRAVQSFIIRKAAAKHRTYPRPRASTRPPLYIDRAAPSCSYLCTL
eukprot:359531-Chlamydomonas_euryale.AAC.4